MNRRLIFLTTILSLVLFVSDAPLCQEPEPEEKTGWIILKGEGQITVVIGQRGVQSITFSGTDGTSFEIPVGHYETKSLFISNSTEKSLKKYRSNFRTVKPFDVVEGATHNLQVGGPLHYRLSAKYIDNSHRVYLDCHALVNDSNIVFARATTPKWEIRDATGSMVVSGRFSPG